MLLSFFPVQPKLSLSLFLTHLSQHYLTNHTNILVVLLVTLLLPLLAFISSITNSFLSYLILTLASFAMQILSLHSAEYKLKIHTAHALSSLRFHFTKTQLSSLDTLLTCFLKSWLSFPPCATTSFLSIPTITSLYSHCHTFS